MKLSLLVAVSENNVIGRDGDLPWHLSADLRRFKRVTMGHVMLMGRKTWESIGRPLPGRTSIVISRQADYETGFEEVLVAANVDEALRHARTLRDARLLKQARLEVFVIGGARIYEMMFSCVERLLLTRVHAEVEGDIFFPEVNWDEWRLVEEESCAADEKNDFAHTHQVFERVTATEPRP
ncbi:MAG: dihydrofolate reductase [Planctomycetes bacterium]|nr:dihydrofolate reductase [Planctomycetota bacterium]